jgi:hypothetical protein
LVLQRRLRPFSTTEMPSTALSRIAWFSSRALRSDSSARFCSVRSSMIQIVPCEGIVGIDHVGDQLRPKDGCRRCGAFRSRSGTALPMERKGNAAAPNFS